jgi:hypothetical protein
MMNCQSSTPERHDDERPATVLIVYPTGMQEPACDACAEYWVNLRPLDTRLAPLESYVNYYVQARAELDARLAAARSEQEARNDVGRAYATCPEDMLRRFAQGAPAPEDCHVLEVMTGLDPAEGGRRFASGYYASRASQVRASAAREDPAPLQTMAWEALRKRGLPPELPWLPGASRPPGATKIGAWPLAAAFLFGLILIGCSLPNGEVSGSQPAAGMIPGVIMVTGSILAGITWLIVVITKEVSDRHRAWLSQLPPGQQQAIRKAETAAAWGLAAAGAVALHEHNKRAGARLTASVVGYGPPPGRAQQAMWHAKQQRRAETQRVEVLDAIRHGSQPDPAPLDSRPLLARGELSPASQRRRRELGW